MKPSRSYHSVVTAHREAGGLRRLDFFVDRCDAWSSGRDRSGVRVLVVGVGEGGVSQALASLGYTVVGVDGDAYSVERARAAARELHLSMSLVVGSARFVKGGPFDIIVIKRMVYGSDAAEQLEDLRPLLAKGGIILCIGRHVRRSHLRKHGWRPVEYRSAGVLLGRVQRFCTAFGLKRGSAMFHFLDSIDSTFASFIPLWASNSVLFELRSFNPKHPYVMHVTHELGHGGAERLVYELVSRLPSNGFEAKAVTVLRGGAYEEAFREEELPLTMLRKRGMFGFGTVRDLVHLFRRERPDVVHTHLFLADTWGRIAARLASVRVIVSTEHNVNPSHDWKHHFVNRALARVTKMHIAVSSEVKRVMMKTEHIKAKKIKVILNGIDLERVIPRGSRPFRDIPRLITVGRLAPQKDHATLLKSLAQIKKPWRLAVVGLGPLERELRVLAERLRIASRVEWLGECLDVPELLADADIFCFPSRWEGLGLAAIEAAAAGVPIIASDLAPLKEILSPSDVTYVPAGDVPAWTKAIERTLGDPMTAVLRANRAVSRVQATTSIDTMVAEYAKIYKQLIRKNT